MHKIDNNKTYGVFSNTVGRILSARIEEAGATVLTFPVRECEKIELAAGDNERMRNLHEFDWVIFTDIFSARFFIEALKAVNLDFSQLDALRICAMGENVVHYLRSFQIHSDLVVSPCDKNIAIAITQFSALKTENLRFLIPTGSFIKSSTVVELELSGTIVCEIPLYRIISFEENDLVRMKALILGGAVDEIVFSNVDDLLTLQFLFPDETLFELLKDVGALAANDDAYYSLIGYGLYPHYL